MISHRLDMAVEEAIQAHALRYHNGKLDLERILAALGEIAASYLAEIPRTCDRQRSFDKFCVGIARAANGRTKRNGYEVLIRS